MHHQSINKFLYWSIFILVVGCIGFILEVFPVGEDDWQFYKQINRHGLIYCINSRFLNDNVRIGNFLGIFLLIVPKWIPATVCAFAFAFGLWIMTKVCNLKQYQWKALITLIFFIWTAPMWIDSMFSHMFAFNYIVPLPLLFGLIYLFQHPDKLPLWMGIILGILLGTWHEAYAIIFIVGAVLNFIVNHRINNRNSLLITVAVCVGFLWHFVSPAIFNRVSNYQISIGYKYIRVFHNWIYLIYIFLWLICFYRIDRKLAKTPLQLFALGSGVIFFIVLYTGIGRASMPSIFICCCAITVLLKRILYYINIKIKNVFALLLAFFTCSSMVAACIETIPIRRIADKIADIYFKSNYDQPYVFGEIYYPWNASRLALRRPDPYILMPGENNRRWLYYYTDKDVFIIPVELQDYSAGKGVKISDNPDLRLWKGHIVSSNVNDTAYHHCHIDYGLRTEYTEIHRIIFNSNDGKPYVYILPKRSTISTYLGDPISIELKK